MSAEQIARGGFRTPLQQLFLLEERVRQAGVRLPDADMERSFHGIKCVVNGKDCVINLREVAEVIDQRCVTPIPGTAKWIEGVINYRGTLVPVYRPHDFLARSADTDAAAANADGHLVVLRKDRKGNEFNAIRVNRMFGMQKFGEGELRPAAGSDTSAEELAYYVDSLVSADGKTWCRLNTARLMERMCGTSPRQL
jgi:chemotaxis signal transduction protein